MEVGWWNEPLKKWDFKFRGPYWKKNTLRLPSWAHNWNRQHMNFQKMPAKKDFCSQLLSQSSVDYPPPIWSLSSSHLITGFHWIPLDLSDFFSYFSSYLQQMAVFRTPISCIAMYLAQVSASTSPWEWIQQVWCFPDSVLCLYYAAMPSVQLFDHLDFKRNITAGAFWMLSILKIMRGENLQFTDWDSWWEDGWRGGSSRSPHTSEESRDQGRLCSASDRAPCPAPRNSWFPGTAGNLVTGIKLFTGWCNCFVFKVCNWMAVKLLPYSPVFRFSRLISVMSADKKTQRRLTCTSSHIF